MIFIKNLLFEGKADSSVMGRDRSFFGSVWEKMEWTTDKLNEGDLELGYVDRGGFREWLGWQYQRLKNHPEIEDFNPWS